MTVQCPFWYRENAKCILDPKIRDRAWCGAVPCVVISSIGQVELPEG